MWSRQLWQVRLNFGIFIFVFRCCTISCRSQFFSGQLPGLRFENENTEAGFACKGCLCVYTVGRREKIYAVQNHVHMFISQQILRLFAGDSSVHWLRKFFMCFMVWCFSPVIPLCHCATAWWKGKDSFVTKAVESNIFEKDFFFRCGWKAILDFQAVPNIHKILHVLQNLPYSLICWWCARFTKSKLKHLNWDGHVLATS